MLLSDQLSSAVCVGQVDFLANETDVRDFFHTEQSRENIRRERESKGGEGGETSPRSHQIFKGWILIVTFWNVMSPTANNSLTFEYFRAQKSKRKF